MEGVKLTWTQSRADSGDIETWAPNARMWALKVEAFTQMLRSVSDQDLNALDTAVSVVRRERGQGS